ncbi:Serine/threonine-protein kinase oca2 [Smittium culicis]|uniref:Serine/threonine-protein kinase oca2 n=1 Tax=Smittium culicis TaxID=133412 RepID=A0A1R1XEH6_9FUNG|nr:Serine/threonine-protein kinase oca2 [Smittium culicis]
MQTNKQAKTNAKDSSTSANVGSSRTKSISRRFQNLIHRLEKTRIDSSANKNASILPASPVNFKDSDDKRFSIGYQPQVANATPSVLSTANSTNSVSLSATKTNSPNDIIPPKAVITPVEKVTALQTAPTINSATISSGPAAPTLPPTRLETTLKNSPTQERYFAPTQNEQILLVGGINRPRVKIPGFGRLPDCPETPEESILLSPDDDLESNPRFDATSPSIQSPELNSPAHTDDLPNIPPLNLSNHHPIQPVIAQDNVNTVHNEETPTETTNEIPISKANIEHLPLDAPFSEKSPNLVTPSTLPSTQAGLSTTNEKPKIAANPTPKMPPPTLNIPSSKKEGHSPSTSIVSGSHPTSNNGMVYSTHEYGLNKYGKTTKIIGKGTGGTVRLLQSVSINQRPPSTRNATNTSQPDTEHVYIPGQQKLFAVKEFRKRKADETPRSYMKKVTSEFCIGSSLHHENVIETLDLIFEGEKVYEIMEYCPYDLFKFVALGEMELDEIFCWFKQICQGVSYIHSLGISHRDLKLENILLTETGIVKLIDFGCATVFKAPFQKNPNKLTGVYGSDPYIAPEVFSKTVPYDAEAADVWSIGIMYMCMTLLKFPWRIADSSIDNNYKSYASNWPRGRDKLFVQLPNLRNEGKKWIERLMHTSADERPSLADLLNSDWAKGIEVCRPGRKSRSHVHKMKIE